MDSKPRMLKRRWLRTTLVAVTILMIFVYEGIEVGWLANHASYIWVALDIFVLLGFGSLAYLAIERMLRAEDTAETLQVQLAQQEKQLSDTRQRQKTILGISQMFADATGETEIMEITLRLSRDLLGARGASFVPLDEHAQPLAAHITGEIPAPAASAWLEYLASPAVRQKCGACQKREQLNRVCPLIQGTSFDAMGIYCLPVRRGDQEFGILNLYFPDDTVLSNDLQSLVRTLLDEAAFSLEGIRLRNRALSTLRQLQVLRENTDLDGMLLDLLNGLHETLDAEFAMVSIWDRQTDRLNTTVISGVLPEDARHLVDGILQSVKISGAPLMLENVTASPTPISGIRALMVVPLAAQSAQASGALLVASQRARAFNPRQLAMLQTIAGQVALVVQNVYLMAQLEYNAIIDERARLAREIHDGLAQTLGFLKLKTAQMRAFVAQNDLIHLSETVETCYSVLSEAYQDARQAIDGLRLSLTDNSLSGWLHQTTSDFQGYSDIEIGLDISEAQIELPPEVHAQLMRIVQEALSNIRKHSHAQRVEIACHEIDGELQLDIQDNGTGFDVHEIPAPSQHGLRGMRERADLIGADFQVISQPRQGTTVCLRLPLGVKVKE